MAYKHDKQLIEKLYCLYSEKMYKKAYQILNNHWQAEDVVSDTFIKIMRHSDKFANLDSSETEAYLMQAIKSVAIDYYRKNKRKHEYEQVLLDEYEFEDSGSFANRIVKEIDAREKVAHFMMYLPQKYKKVLLLRCVEELSVKETAEQLNITECAVRKRYERGKKLLKNMDMYLIILWIGGILLFSGTVVAAGIQIWEKLYRDDSVNIDENYIDINYIEDIYNQQITVDTNAPGVLDFRVIKALKNDTNIIYSVQIEIVDPESNIKMCNLPTGVLSFADSGSVTNTGEGTYIEEGNCRVEYYEYSYANKQEIEKVNKIILMYNTYLDGKRAYWKLEIPLDLASTSRVIYPSEIITVSMQDYDVSKISVTCKGCTIQYSTSETSDTLFSNRDKMWLLMVTGEKLPLNELCKNGSVSNNEQGTLETIAFSVPIDLDKVQGIIINQKQYFWD